MLYNKKKKKKIFTFIIYIMVFFFNYLFYYLVTIFSSKYTLNKILDHWVSNRLNRVSIWEQKLYLKNYLM